MLTSYKLNHTLIYYQKWRIKQRNVTSEVKYNATFTLG